MLVYLIIFLSVITLISSAVLILAIIRKINNPEKSIFYCFLNIVLTPFRFLELGPYQGGSINVDKCLQLAIKNTAAADIGDDMEFMTIYRNIMDNPYHKTQQLTNVGYLVAQLELSMIFSGRLYKLRYFKENPASLNVPVRQPVFVTGLPRTGTTFLHRLLSLDPAVRAPLLWELVNSVPLVSSSATLEEKAKCREKRRNFVVQRLKYREIFGDDSLTHIHEIGADLPEECLMAMREEVPLNLQHLMTIYMDYNSLISTVNIKKAYIYYRKTLQLLSFQMGDTEAANPKRWMLKCPMHLIFTKDIKAVFPDAKLIWTHRHPVSAVPSMCSLLKACHQTYYEKSCRDDHALGKQLKNVTAEWLQKAPQDIQESGIPCCNIIYNSLVSKPIETVKSIYKHFEWNFTGEYEAILTEYLIKNKKERDTLKLKQGTSALHTYEPKEFGLTEKELCEGAFGEYVCKFNVPMSRN